MSSREVLLWLWDDIIEEWVKALAVVRTSAILSADAQVKASAGKVYWLTVADTAGLLIELNDSIGDGGIDRWGTLIPAGGHLHCLFDPPIDFDTGIWLDVSTVTCRVVVGYI